MSNEAGLIELIEVDAVKLAEKYRPNRFLRAPLPMLEAAAPRRQRCGIYIRYSKDGINDGSVERQIRNTSDYARVHDFRVVAHFEDLGISGASTHRRLGLKQAVAFAELGLIDILVVDQFDRFSRDESDAAQIFKRFRLLDVELHDTKMGRVNLIEEEFLAVTAAEERSNALIRTRDGKQRAAHRGEAPYSLPYAFQKRKGRVIIHPERATQVRKIFKLASKGVEPRDIAALCTGPVPGDCQRIDLGQESRGVAWNAGMIVRILRNPTYAGIHRYGATRVQRNPYTLEKISQEYIEPDDRTTIYIPSLAIVNRPIWDSVQGRIGVTHHFSRNTGAGQNMKALTHLVYCGHCHGEMVAVKQKRTGRNDQLRCRTECCAGNARILIPVIERFVCEALITELQNVSVIEPPPSYVVLDTETVTALDALRDELSTSETKHPPQGHDLPFLGDILNQASQIDKASWHIKMIQLALMPNWITAPTVNIATLCRNLGDCLCGDPTLSIQAPTKAVFEDLRRIIDRVEATKSEDTYSLTLHMNSTAVGAASEIREQIVLPELDLTNFLKGSAPSPETKKQQKLVYLSERPAAKLDGKIAQELKKRLVRLDTDLVSIGWSLPTVTEAVMFRKRTGCTISRMPPTFGPSATLEAAVSIVRRSGMRGTIAEILHDAEGNFAEAAEELFSRSGKINHLPKLLELALSEAMVNKLRAAAEHRHKPLFGRVADWLEASGERGIASAIGDGDAELTCALVRLGREGVDGLLVQGPCPAGQLVSEIKEVWATGISDVVHDRADLLVEHLLSGEVNNSKWDPLYKETPGQWICLYRVTGPSAILKGKRKADRLTQAQIGYLSALVPVGVDPADPSKPLNRDVLCRIAEEEFGCLLGLDAMTSILGKNGLSVVNDRLHVPLSKGRHQALQYSEMHFAGEGASC
jgi:DNA invertase Pin-like site-specific DNA recombinase